MKHLFVKALITFSLAFTVLSVGCSKMKSANESSGSNRLKCKTADDCLDYSGAVECQSGYCVDERGERVSVVDVPSNAGSGEGGSSDTKESIGKTRDVDGGAAGFTNNTDAGLGKAGQGGDSGAVGQNGEAGESGSKPRLCDEGATVERAEWQRIQERLEAFLSASDQSQSSSGVDTGGSGLAGVAYGNGIWLLLGNTAPYEARIRWATSEDGVHWESASQETSEGATGVTSRVFFVGNQFVFFAQHDPRSATPRLAAYTSRDGHSWSTQPFPSNTPFVFNLASSETHTVLAAGPAQVLSSTDLATWERHTLINEDIANGVTDVAYGGDRWIASSLLSWSEDGRYQSEGRAYGSVDAVHWERIDLTGLSDFSLAYGNGLWIATNYEGEYRTSTDGLTFVGVRPSGVWGGLSAKRELQLRYSGGRFIRHVIDYEEIPPSRIRLIISHDGSSWRDFGEVAGLNLPKDALNIEYTIADVAYGNCRYVIAGTYEILVPGALDPPNFRSEIGPFLITADLSTDN